MSFDSIQLLSPSVSLTGLRVVGGRYVGGGVGGGVLRVVAANKFKMKGQMPMLSLLLDKRTWGSGLWRWRSSAKGGNKSY